MNSKTWLESDDHEVRDTVTAISEEHKKVLCVIIILLLVIVGKHACFQVRLAATGLR